MGITIRTTEDKILLTVSDNGVGIGREDLERMRESLKHPSTAESKEGKRGNGVALTNVSQRIKLIFGGDYGLEVYSTQGVGTDVEIVLPVITNDRELNRGALS